MTIQIVHDAEQPHVRLSAVQPTCVWVDRYNSDTVMVAEWPTLAKDATAFSHVAFDIYLHQHGFSNLGISLVNQAIRTLSHGPIKSS